MIPWPEKLTVPWLPMRTVVVSDPINGKMLSGRAEVEGVAYRAIAALRWNICPGVILHADEREHPVRAR